MSSSDSRTAPVYLDTDWALSQIGDVESMNGMLQMLQESLARDIPQVDALLQAGDVAAANRVLHALKGFIPIFCQQPLCEQVVQVEALSKDPLSQAVGPAYRTLQPKLETLLAEVDWYLQAGVS
jgi:HPt (histidine-containing phosphotransfer) domain-containing protein